MTARRGGSKRGAAGKATQAHASSVPAAVRRPSGQPEPAGKLDLLWPVLVLALVALMGCVEIEDPDIWWHLRTGQLIAERGNVPRTDWFTYTNPDSEWIDLHWGFQLMAAALWAWGGPAALVLWKSVLGTATFALALGASRASWPRWQTAACWLPSLVIFFGRNQVRPEIFSFLFLAASLAVLYHARRHPRLVWLLPPIQVLWINVHGLFVLGLVVWLCFLADRVIRSFWQRGTDEAPASRADWRRWWLVSGMLALAALVNPYGYRGAWFPVTLWARLQGEQRGFYGQFAQEFQGLGDFLGEHGPMAWAANTTTLMLVAVYLLGAASFLLLLGKGRFHVFGALVFVAFGYLGWQASRNSVLFALAGGMVLRWNFGDYFERAGPRNSPRLHAGRMLTAICLGLLLAAVPSGVLSLLTTSVSRRSFGLGETPDWFAHRAARFLAGEGMPRNVYAADQGPAAVYIFHNGPERRVFADGRLEVNTPETLRRYLQVAAQLNVHDPGALRNLTRGLPVGPDGRPEVPALLFDLETLAGAVPGILTHPEFRPVFLDEAAIVLLTHEQADKLRLRPLPVEGLAEAIRRRQDQSPPAR